MLRWKRTKNKPETKPFQWSSQSFTLQEILSRFKLPCLVQCCYDSCVIEWTDLRFDLAQPLLLHSTRKASKVCVRCVRNNNTGETTPSYVIPEDYDGWFYFMKEDSDRPSPLRSVEMLLSAMTSLFYVSESDSCLCIYEDACGKQTLDERRLEKGEILQKCHTTDTTELRKIYINDKYLNKQNRFLVCNDEKDDQILLDLAKDGKFYEIAEAGDTTEGLCRITEVISRKTKFPFKIRHVIGELPSLSTSYTNILQCYDVIEEETVLAATLDEQTMIPLELQINSPFKFKISLNESQLKQTDTYNEALKMCENDGESYVRGIKLSFTVSPDVNIESSVDSFDSDISSNHCYFQRAYTGPAFQETTDDSPSVCDIGSDVEEEDAQSEFSFKWTPTETSQNKPVVLLKPPKVFNSSISSINKSPNSSLETGMEVWNEEPDEV